MPLIKQTTTQITEGTNLYYTQTRFNTAFSAKSTSDLAEGTNLYWTDGRFDSRLASSSLPAINLSGTVPAANLSSGNLITALGFTPEDSADKGVANGYASLGADGKVPSSQLPAIAITDTFVVASEAAMLALTAETGDVAVRTDESKSYILKGTDPSVLADWEELLSPAAPVQSVNGQTGSVSLDTDDISEGSTNLYYTSGRFDTAFGTKTTTDLAEGTNLYYTSGRFDTAFSSKSTTDLTEGTNLYYTQSRFNTAFAAKTTTDLAEGTNLYHTTGRVQTVGDARYLQLTGGTLTGQIITAASTTGGSGFRLTIGAAPTSPVNGDFWMNASGVLSYQAASSTFTILNNTSGLNATNLTTGTIATARLPSSVPLTNTANNYTNYQQISYNDSSNLGSLYVFNTSTSASAAAKISFGVELSGVTNTKGSIRLAKSPTANDTKFTFQTNVGGVLTDQLSLDGASGLVSNVIVVAPASTTSSASLRVPHGTAPTSPTNGDIWTTTAGGMFTRHNGNTRTIAFLEAAQTWAGTQTFGTISATSISGNGSGITNVDANTLDGLNSSAFEQLSNKGAANGYASLGADSKIPVSQLPAIAITDTFVVSGTVAMLALTAETGDVAIRTDESKTYILKGTDPTQEADWEELLSPTSTVQSVNGQTGVITLTTTDIAEGTNLYWTNSRFDTRFGTKSTTDLAEGTNLYYTQGRFDTAFTAKDTDDLAEGSTNLYFTNSRADARIAAATINTSQLSGAIVATKAPTQAFAQLWAVGLLNDFIGETVVDYYVNSGGAKTIGKIVLSSDLSGSTGSIEIDILKKDTVGGSLTTLFTTVALPTLTANGGLTWTVVTGAGLPDVVSIPDGAVLVLQITDAPTDAENIKVELYEV